MYRSEDGPGPCCTHGEPEMWVAGQRLLLIVTGRLFFIRKNYHSDFLSFDKDQSFPIFQFGWSISCFSSNTKNDRFSKFDIAECDDVFFSHRYRVQRRKPGLIHGHKSLLRRRSKSESITYRWTEGSTDWRTDTSSYRVSSSRLKVTTLTDRSYRLH